MVASLASMSLARINALNIVLMIASLGVAAMLPFELLLVSYALLGPLHYLTEISWLHDRDYFVTGRWDALVLVLPALPITAHFVLKLEPGFNLTALLFGLSLAAAAAMTFSRSAPVKIAVVLFAVLPGYGLAASAAGGVALGLLLPTVVHVFCFTGVFILFGSLKARSGSGYLSFVVFIACAAAPLLWRPSAEGWLLRPEVGEALRELAPVNFRLVDLFGWERSQDTVLAVQRFLAWAYTYHYLNWFSKTKVIGWHQVSRRRLGVILAAWIASVALYVVDYALGFAVLFGLSVAHVLLELPLNHRAIAGTLHELGQRLRPRGEERAELGDAVADAQSARDLLQ